MADLNPNRANVVVALEYVSGADFIGGNAYLVTAQLGNVISAQLLNSDVAAPANTTAPAVFRTALTTANALVSRMAPQGLIHVPVTVRDNNTGFLYATTMTVETSASKVQFTLHPPASGWPGTSVRNGVSVENMEIVYMALAQSGRDYQAA